MSKSDTIKRPRSADKNEAWKGKSPTSNRRRGQWKDHQSEDDESGVGFVSVGAKTRPEEREAFKKACAARGVTPNKAIRSFIRQCCGYLEISDEALDHLETITRQISGVSTNINQIAKAGNRTLSPDFIAFMEDRKELGAQLARLEDMMREVINVARRRSDGLRKLDDVVSSEQGGQT